MRETIGKGGNLLLFPLVSLSFADFLEIKWYNERYGKRKIACQYAKFK